jgi:hypothetical protein
MIRKEKKNLRDLSAASEHSRKLKDYIAQNSPLQIRNRAGMESIQYISENDQTHPNRQSTNLERFSSIERLNRIKLNNNPLTIDYHSHGLCHPITISGTQVSTMPSTKPPVSKRESFKYNFNKPRPPTGRAGPQDLIKIKEISDVGTESRSLKDGGLGG